MILLSKMRRATSTPMVKVCDLCGKPAVVDAPTRGGRWGYLCYGCLQDHGTVSAEKLGTKII